MNEELKIIISAEVAKVKQGVKQAKQEISNFSKKVEEAKKNVDASFKAMGNGIKTATKVIAASIAGVGVALIGVAANTEEYRNQQALLKTAFENAGASAETAKETYNSLYRVMGDSDAATEAAQSLARLTADEKALGEYTTILTGIWGDYGKGMPVETIAEAVAETAACGTITGDLSRALVEAGVSEEDFQKKLDATNSEAEREKLIRETLLELYKDSAATYEKNNKAVLEQRDAQAKLQEKLAAVGAAIAPLNTAFVSLAADALALVEPYITKLAETAIPKLQELLDGIIPALESAAAWIKEHTTLLTAIAAVIGTVVAAITLYNTVAAIKAAMAAAEVATVAGLTTAYLAQAAAVMMAIAPYLLIVAAVALLVAGFLYLWENCEGFRQFWLNLWEQLKAAFALFVETLEPLWNAIVNMFVQAWELIKVVWDIVQPYFAMLWESIKAVFAVVVEILGGYFAAAWEAIKIVWDVVVSYFTTIFNTIATIFSVIKNVLSGNFEAAWNGVKAVFKGWGNFFIGLFESIASIFSVVGNFFVGVFNTAVSGIKGIFEPIVGFFSGIWDSITSIFGSVGVAVGDAIKGAVSGAVNAVLSTAANIINGFISAINVAIGIINAIPGVSIGYLNKLSVPAMAKGGIVDSATLAVVGEQGKEAVVPLENNLEWLDKLAGMLNDRMGGNQPIVLNIDGKRFAEISVDSINSLTRQRGSIPLVIA